MLKNGRRMTKQSLKVSSDQGIVKPEEIFKITSIVTSHPHDNQMAMPCSNGMCSRGCKGCKNCKS
jgi:hypothetical protein